jgi:hypothetical protein
MQSKHDLEDWYSQPDRWGYFNNPEDNNRLNNILYLLGLGKNKYNRAIDIGCGEGFITHHLPAEVIHGYDLSNNALSRLPQNVKSVTQPEGKYDLVLSTGTLYSQYDHESIYEIIMGCASEYILIGGISSWIIEKDFGTEIKSFAFPYREFTQKITLYHVETSTQHRN